MNEKNNDEKVLEIPESKWKKIAIGAGIATVGVYTIGFIIGHRRGGADAGKSIYRMNQDGFIKFTDPASGAEIGVDSWCDLVEKFYGRMK